MLLFAFSGALLAFGAPAGSQGSEPYVSPFGDLTIVADDLLPGSMVMLSGDGFTPETPVFLTVRQNATADVLVEDEGAADGDGAVEFELVLTEGFEPGGYSALVRGTTIDGAILDLSGGFNVDGPDEPTVTPTPDPGPELPTPTPTAVPTARPTATPLPTPRPPILGPTPTPEGAVPTPTPTLVPVAPGDGDDEGDAEVLGQSVDDDAAAAESNEGGSSDASDGGAQEGAAAGSDQDDPVASGEADDDAGDEIAAPAIEGSGGVGGAQVAGILAAVALIGGGAFVMYRRSTRTTPTHAE